MEHLGSIVWLISLPVVIVLTYKTIRWALNKFEKNL